MMKLQMRTFRYTLPFLLLALVTLYGCDDFIQPTNHIIDYYVSPDANKNEIKKVALFPMAKDDTTNTGTFYSTNHFINNLEKYYDSIKFFIPSIDTLVAADSLFVPHFIDKIEISKNLNLESFDSSGVGKIIAKDHADAIIIGKINNVSYRNGVGLVRDEFLHFEFRSITSCDFTYYLISLTDGKIIWKIRTIGEAVNYSHHKDEVYPPLDMAISNGIDLILQAALPENEIQ